MVLQRPRNASRNARFLTINPTGKFAWQIRTPRPPNCHTVPAGVGWTVAVSNRAWRKVRASQGKVPGNAWGKRRRQTRLAISRKVPQKANRRWSATTQARVKGCGKSAPRGWQHPRHGKPHLKQGQIGMPRRGPRRIRVGR